MTGTKALYNHAHTWARYLMVITGAFGIGGGIAAVNRLVMKAIDDHEGQEYHLDVLSLLEQGEPLESHYFHPERVSYQCFAGNRVRFILALWRKLASTRYDWVHCDLVSLAASMAPWAWAGRCRYTVWLYGMDVFSLLPGWRGKIGLRGAWKRLAISEYTRDRVLERYDVSITTCELALDPVKYGVEMPELESGTNLHPPIALVAADGNKRMLGAQVILHVGRMASREQYKGQDVLIRTMPAVLSQFPRAQLVLAGHGDDLPRLLSLARSMSNDVRSAVFLPGYVPDSELDELYNACYLFAMPSVGEGFGLVYLEAMRRAKPCIGGKVDATPCVVEDGVTGLLVDDPRSPEQVAQAILHLMQQPEQASGMGIAGYQRVRTRFLFPHFVERFWKIIEA